MWSLCVCIGGCWRPARCRRGAWVEEEGGGVGVGWMVCVYVGELAHWDATLHQLTTDVLTSIHPPPPTHTRARAAATMQRVSNAIEALAALADHAKALQLSTYPEVGF